MPSARPLFTLVTGAVSTVATLCASMCLVATPVDARELADPRRPVSVNAGIGLGDFASDLGTQTESGVAWSVRVGWTPFPILGGELAFLSVNGSLSTRVSGPGTPVTRQTVGLQQVTAAARVHWPVAVGVDSSLEPYAHAGVGYGRLASNDPSSVQGIPTEHSVAIPLGAGIAWNINQALTLDGRFTYSLLPNAEIPLIGDAGAWSAVVSVGARLGR